MKVECWISSHNHSVQLREGSINEQFTCQICSRSVCGAPFYSCDSCSGFCVHKSCAELPYQIQQPFHSHSLLFMRPNRSTFCNTCFKDFKDAPFYNCGSCQNFDMDPECALMPLVTSGRKGRGWIKHFGHQHPLLRVDDQHIKCFVCHETHLPLDLYGCSKCGYFLHKSCTELPAEIHLPIHRNHRAALSREVTGRSFVCGMCRICTEDRYKLTYKCDQCSLRVCFKCTEVAWTSSGSFKYEDHDHLLCLVQNIKDITTSLLSRCDGYDSYCTQHAVTSSDEFKKTESFMLWCYQCGFRVHLLCGPLPSVVKHEFHIHSLILVDSMREDDYGEYYCDVCETKRDPRIRLYCCQECKYFAHVHCVIPEMVKILSEDLKDVELKTMGQDTWNMPRLDLKMDHVDPSLTLKDVINKLSGREKYTFRSYYNEASSRDQKGNKEFRDYDKDKVEEAHVVEDEEIDEILQLSHFTHGTFRSFWSNLQVNRKRLGLKPSDLALKIVKVKGYMIPQSLTAVLNKLLYEFEDIGSGLTSSIEFKSFVLFIVCKVVKGMYSTMPTCITKDILQEWYLHLRFARSQNFKVDFACAKLEQLIHAFLGFQAKRLEEEIPTILSQKIDELQRKSNELQRKLDKCKEYRGSSSKSEYMEFCLNKASENERKMNASGDSLSQKRSPEDSQWIEGVDMWSD